LDVKRFRKLLKEGRTTRQTTDVDWERLYERLPKDKPFRFADVRPILKELDIKNEGAARLRLNKWCAEEPPRLFKVYDKGTYYAVPELINPPQK